MDRASVLPRRTTLWVFRAALVAALITSWTCASPSEQSAEPTEPATPPVEESTVATPPDPAGIAPAVIAESWESPRDVPANVDSVAFWQGDAGSWVVATGKESNDLLVLDAETGELVRRVGGPGDQAGQLLRPNGIQVAEDLLLVVERDNHRVQGFSLPDFESVLLLGGDVLTRPYGGTVIVREPGVYDLFVTDNYETPSEEIPPPAELDERVHHFRITHGADGVRGDHVRAFGATEGPGVLLKVETLMADVAREQILVAEEHDSELRFEVYGTDGTFTGDILWGGDFTGEPEGLALWSCGDAGYWVATDQHPSTSYFRVYDRLTQAYLGAFSGPLTANTDGVTLTQEATETFPAGAFFAVHDDQSVTAFDWREIAEALGLDVECAEGASSS